MLLQNARGFRSEVLPLPPAPGAIVLILLRRSFWSGHRGASLGGAAGGAAGGGRFVGSWRWRRGETTTTGPPTVLLAAGRSNMGGGGAASG